jgi:hypothetical protein
LTSLLLFRISGVTKAGNKAMTKLAGWDVMQRPCEPSDINILDQL